MPKTIKQRIKKNIKYQISPSKNKKHKTGLSSDDLALTNTSSTIDLLVDGYIESVIDLSDENILHDFYDIVKEIKLTPKLKKKANRLNIPVMYHVSKYSDLKGNILIDKWRNTPALMDIPANSQIFGQLAHESGIEAILYPSRMSEIKKCLAIYPRNLLNSNSYVRIKDDNLPMLIEYTQLDSNTCLSL